MADKIQGVDTSTGSSIPYFEDDGGGPWEQLILGPHTLPGVWSVRGKSRRRIDVKTSKSQDGARFRDQGYEPAKLVLTGRMIGAADFNAMVKALKDLHPRRRGVSMKPLQAEHPALVALGVGNLLIEEVSAPYLSSEGLPTFEMSALEWIPKPKPKPPTATDAILAARTELDAALFPRLGRDLTPSSSAVASDGNYYMSRQGPLPPGVTLDDGG